eukprot:6185750-Pleurochrysis_carterae.AAC.1
MCNCSCKALTGTKTALQRHSVAHLHAMHRTAAAAQHTHQWEASFLLEPAAELPQPAKEQESVLSTHHHDPVTFATL